MGKCKEITEAVNPILEFSHLLQLPIANGRFDFPIGNWKSAIGNLAKKHRIASAHDPGTLATS
jgi:hypothetical protein